HHTVTRKLVVDDIWFNMHIIAIGNRIIIKVGDEIATDYTDYQQTRKDGRLALQEVNLQTIAQFRNLVVKRLPEDERQAWAIASEDTPDIASVEPAPRQPP